MDASEATTGALVVIDMQNGFVNRHTRHILPAVSDLAARWTAAHRPVVFTRYINHAGSPFERLLNWSRLQTSPETDLVPELSPHTESALAIVDKPAYTYFTPEGIALAERERWHHLVFCGIATDSCVLKSLADAFELGYTPWLVTDASASDAGPDVHEAAIRIAARFIGSSQLITSDQLLPHLPPQALD